MAGSGLASAALMFSRGDATAQETLVSLLTSAERWQEFRIAAYRVWHAVNESVTAEYLKAVD
jgi:hypothetical protein